LRDFYFYCYDMISFCLSVYPIKTFFRQFYLFAILAALWNGNCFLLTVNCVHFDISAEDSIKHRDLTLRMSISPRSFDRRMFSYSNFDEEIPVHVPFSPELQIRSILDSLRKVDFFSCSYSLNSSSSTRITRRCYNLPLAITRITHSSEHHHTLLDADVTRTFTGFTCLRLCSWFCLTSITGSTNYFSRIFHFLH
jgi:hypothetical protein